MTTILKTRRQLVVKSPTWGEYRSLLEEVSKMDRRNAQYNE